MSPSSMKIGRHKDGKQMQLIDDIDLCTLSAIVAHFLENLSEDS